MFTNKRIYHGMPLSIALVRCVLLNQAEMYLILIIITIAS
jgi:hypothetical protein